jgi:hypothetical protein
VVALCMRYVPLIAHELCVQSCTCVQRNQYAAASSVDALHCDESLEDCGDVAVMSDANELAACADAAAALVKTNRYFAHLEVKPSPMERVGMGLFIGRAIPAYKIIGEFFGIRMTVKVANRIGPNPCSSTCRQLRISRRRCLMPAKPVPRTSSNTSTR